jgi:hypothetical protein
MVHVGSPEREEAGLSCFIAPRLESTIAFHSIAYELRIHEILTLWVSSPRRSLGT